MSPAFWAMCAWWGGGLILISGALLVVHHRDHRPDPLIEDEEVSRLEELWSMPTRDHA